LNISRLEIVARELNIFPITSWLEKVSKTSLSVFKLDAKLIINFFLGIWSGLPGGGAAESYDRFLVEIGSPISTCVLDDEHRRRAEERPKRRRTNNCCVEHAHVSQTLLASLRVHRIDRFLVLHHLYLCLSIHKHKIK
jgi:hypothetical protein